MNEWEPLKINGKDGSEVSHVTKYITIKRRKISKTKHITYTTI